MKNSLIGAAIAAATLLGATAAQAQPYVGVSAGQSDYKVDCTGASSCDNQDAGYKLFGGWMFTPNFGVEGALFDLGKARGATDLPIFGPLDVQTRARGISLVGVAALPVDDFALFAKAGVAYTRAELKASGAFGGTETESTFNPVYGVGASYAFTRNIGARIEWERFRIEYPGSQKDDADLISAGITYRF